jgi:hypothetical protein
MSFDDVPPDEMGIDPHAADDALERMLFGAPVSDEWRDVASFVGELQEAVPATDLASEDLHVAAMVDTAHLLADTGDPVVRPVSNAVAPAPQASGLPKQRRKPMQRKKTVARLLIAPIAAAFVALGGMAYAGALPWSGHDTAPTTVSPDDGDSQGLASEDDQGEDTQGDVSKDDTVTPPADDQGDQGENADDQGDSNDQGTTSDDQGDQSTSSDDQGENDDNQGDNNDQGEDSQGDSTDQSGDSTDQSGDSQGDSTGSGSTSGGDQGGDTTSGGDQGGDSQD